MKKIEGKLKKEDFEKCIHPWEKSRYWLAVGVVTTVSLIYLVSTLGIGILIVPIIPFLGWITVRILRAHLLGSYAEVTNDNFPEIYELLNQITIYLDYPKRIEAYVYQDGDVNAFLLRHFRTRIIMLPHELLVDMLDEPNRPQLAWILARAVGHLKAKHFRLVWLNNIIEFFEKLLVLNIFLLPWERATQYTGDRIGLAVCQDLEAAMLAINKLMVGNILAKKTTLLGAIKQQQRISKSFFGWLAESLSTHPHLTKRISSLLNWSRTHYPTIYNQFLEKQSNHEEIEFMIRLFDETTQAEEIEVMKDKMTA